MKLLAVPNWSFARERLLAYRFEEILASHVGEVHFNQGDLDHNRTVTAFSGESEDLQETLELLQAAAFDVIDLSRHVGVHPRIGALDVCPFVPLDSTPIDALNAWVSNVADSLATRWGVPVFLYERSERGRHEADLPTLRRGGFGALINKELKPDFGPTSCHLRLGVTVMGVRDFLVAMNVNLATNDLQIAKAIAKEIRGLRAAGDLRFLGVRALGLPLASSGTTQVSMNLTMPDVTPIDPILEWVAQRADKMGVLVAQNELIGVIRDKDIATATRLPIRSQQIVPMGEAQSDHRAS